MKKALIVTHTHWDREWRYPIWENRQYLLDLMDELLKILDTQEEYSCFLTDGQSVMVEDYLKMRPENREKVEKYIKDGRIDVGPWYTLPDLYPVAGESLVRNLLKGSRVSEKLGRRLNIAHESFGWGQTAQFPQIYKGFGLDFVVVAKSLSNDRCPECEFLWEAPDGTKLLATKLGVGGRANFFASAYMPATIDKDYYNDDYYFKLNEGEQIYHEADSAGFWEDYFVVGDNSKVDPKKAKDAFIFAWDNMSNTVMPDLRLMMNGCDSTTAQPYLVELISEIQKQIPDIEVKTASLEEYVNEFKKLVDENSLRVIKGELRDGPATACSANALATRPRIKALNKKAENLIFKTAEPLSAMENKYNKTFLDKAIEYLLLAHPHDSINGVTQDKTADDTIYRLNQAIEIAEAVANTACKNIVKNIDFSEFADDEAIIVLFNTLPYKRREIIKVYIDFPQAWNVWDFEITDGENKLEKQIISRREVVCPVSNLHSRPFPYKLDRYEILIDTGEVPAMGYKTLKVSKTKTSNRNAYFWPEMRTFSGAELMTGNHMMENEFVSVKVNPNGTITICNKETGRMYTDLNYFEDTGDCGDYWIYYAPYHNKTFNTLGANADIWYEENGTLGATIAAKIKMEVPACANLCDNVLHSSNNRSEELVEIEITTYYTLKKGAKSVDVKTVINNTAKDHRMRVVFDTGIKTDVAKSAGHFYVDERPVVPAEKEYYPEMRTLPKGYFVTLENEKEAFSVIDNCTCEYEADKDGRLYITLFRGMRNVICSEFRSGGIFPHEDGGQSLGELVFEYKLSVSGDAQGEAEAMSAAIKCIQTSKMGHGTEATSKSLLEISKPLVMTAFKKCENSDKYMIRFFNPTNQTQNGKISTDMFKDADYTNLNEQYEGKADFENIEVSPYKIKTITFDRR